MRSCGFLRGGRRECLGMRCRVALTARPDGCDVARRRRRRRRRRISLSQSQHARSQLRRRRRRRRRREKKKKKRGLWLGNQVLNLRPFSSQPSSIRAAAPTISLPLPPPAGPSQSQAFSSTSHCQRQIHPAFRSPLLPSSRCPREVMRIEPHLVVDSQSEGLVSHGISDSRCSFGEENRPRLVNWCWHVKLLQWGQRATRGPSPRRRARRRRRRRR